MGAENTSSGNNPRAWSSPPFRWAFAALTTSTIGSQISQLAIPLIAVLTLDATPIQMGILSAAAVLPTFVVSLVAGVVVDRLQRHRRVMIASDVVRAALLLSVPFLAARDMLSIPFLALVVLLVGSATVFHELAQNAFIPDTVSKAALPDANAKLQISYSTGESAGPGLGGLLVTAFTAPVTVVIDAISYVVSAAFLVRAKVDVVRRSLARKNPIKQGLEGIRVLLADPLLGPWARWGAVSVIFMSGFEAQYILYATRELGLSPGWIGLVAAFAGLGAIPVAYLMNRIEALIPVGKSIIGGLMIYFFLLIAVPAASGPVAVVVVVLAIAKILQTFAFTVSNVQQWSLRQLTTEQTLLGRVSAGNRFLIGTAETGGALLSGIVAEAIGMRPYLVLCGVLGTIVLLPLIGRPLWRLRALPR